MLSPSACCLNATFTSVVGCSNNGGEGACSAGACCLLLPPRTPSTAMHALMVMKEARCSCACVGAACSAFTVPLQLARLLAENEALHQAAKAGTAALAPAAAPPRVVSQPTGAKEKEEHEHEQKKELPAATAALAQEDSTDSSVVATLEVDAFDATTVAGPDMVHVAVDEASAAVPVLEAAPEGHAKGRRGSRRKATSLSSDGGGRDAVAAPPAVVCMATVSAPAAAPVPAPAPAPESNSVLRMVTSAFSKVACPPLLARSCTAVGTSVSARWGVRVCGWACGAFCCTPYACSCRVRSLVTRRPRPRLSVA